MTVRFKNGSVYSNAERRFVRADLLAENGIVADPAYTGEVPADAEIVDFDIVATRAIREELPEARIGALSIADFSNAWRFGKFLGLFAAQISV